MWLPCFQSDRETFKSVPEGTLVITQFKSKRPVTKYNNKSIPEGYV